MTKIIWWHLKTRLNIRWWVFNFILRARVFSFRVTSTSTVFILLQKTLKSVFLPRYKSLKLNHDTKLFDDIWRHGWRSVDECAILYKEQKFFHFVLQSIYCFYFYCKRRSKSVVSTTLWIFKTKPWHKLFDESEDTVEDPLISVQFYIESNSFFISC